MREFIKTPECVKINSVNTLFLRTADRNFYFAGESHNFWELVYVSKGNVGITADDKVYMLPEGCLALHKPMEFHRIWSGEGTKPEYSILSFTASGSRLSKLENRVIKCSEYMNELLKNAFGMRNSAFEYENCLTVGGVKNSHDAFKCITFFELALNEACISNDVIEPEKGEDVGLFGKAVTYLLENLSSKITVEKLAEVCYVSTSKIKRVFSKYVGCGIAEYFNHMKINKAQTLLESGMSACDVSESLGFSNQFYFSSVFKRITAMTPTQYKKTVMRK